MKPHGVLTHHLTSPERQALGGRRIPETEGGEATTSDPEESEQLYEKT